MFKFVICILIILALVIGFLFLVSSGVAGQVRVYPEGITGKTVDIPRQEGYKINFAHPYEMVTTDNGYDLIIHFVEK